MTHPLRVQEGVRESRSRGVVTVRFSSVLSTKRQAFLVMPGDDKAAQARLLPVVEHEKFDPEAVLTGPSDFG